MNTTKVIIENMLWWKNLQRDIEVTQWLYLNELGQLTKRKVRNLLYILDEHNFPNISKAIKDTIAWDKKVKKWKNFSSNQEKQKYEYEKRVLDDMALCLKLNKDILWESFFGSITKDWESKGSYRWDKTTIYDLVYTFYELKVGDIAFGFDLQRIKSLSWVSWFKLTPYMKGAVEFLKNNNLL